VTAALLDEDQARWLVDNGASIIVSSCDATAGPSIGQGIGCRVEPDRKRVRVFMVEARSRQVLEDLRAGRPIAVVFTHSPTLRSLQLKARHARLVPLELGDRERVDAHVNTVVTQWTYAPEPYVRTLLATGPGELVAIELEPSAAFDQTPGPQAGVALSKGARS